MSLNIFRCASAPLHSVKRRSAAAVAAGVACRLAREEASGRDADRRVGGVLGRETAARDEEVVHIARDQRAVWHVVHRLLGGAVAGPPAGRAVYVDRISAATYRIGLFS